MRLRDLFGAQQHVVIIDGDWDWATAATVSEEVVFRAPHDLKLTAVRWIPKTAVVGHATNYITLSVVNKGDDGTGTTVMALHAFDDAGTVDDIAAYDEHAIDLSGTAANILADAGDVISVEKEVGGTGESGDGILIIEYISN